MTIPHNNVKGFYLYFSFSRFTYKTRKNDRNPHFL